MARARSALLYLGTYVRRTLAFTVELSVQAGSADPARTTIVFVQPFTIGRNFLLATHTDTGGDWLKASVLPAGAGGLFSVDVNSQTLSPGTYSGTVTVTAPGTAQGALILPVKLTVWDGVPALSASWRFAPQ